MAIAWLVATTACPATDDPVATTPTPSHGDPAPSDFRAEAHAKSFERLLPLARTAFDALDPLVASTLADTPPSPRRFTSTSRAAVHDAVEAAWKEAATLRGELLTIEQATLLEVTRFGLSRARDEVFRLPVTRVDPAIGISATAALVDELAARGLACEGCDAALVAAAPELDAAIADLGATTPAAARAAASDAAELEARLRRELVADPTRKAGTEALGAALGRAKTRLEAIATALDAAKGSAVPRERIAPAAAPADVLRLPDRMGKAALRRWLDVHEDESREATALVARLVPAATQLRALADEGPPTPATPVDEARCTAEWTALEAFASQQPTLVRAFDCARDRWRLPETADDATLAIALVDAGIVGPTRRANRKHTEPTLARVGGDVAPSAHRHALALAVLSGAKRGDARARVAASAHRALCTAIVALWTHGELGTDAERDAAIGSACEGLVLDQLRDAAIARPTAALAGLGLELLGTGPADAIALERGWWLPIGLVLAVARPEAPAPDAPVTVRSEPITPSGATPP